MGKFLNRILGMKVDMQNSMFEYFARTMDAIIDSAKREGRFEMGILELGKHRYIIQSSLNDS